MIASRRWLLAVVLLATVGLALADPAWTAAPREPTGDHRSLPPAIVVDIDETILGSRASTGTAGAASGS